VPPIGVDHMHIPDERTNPHRHVRSCFVDRPPSRLRNGQRSMWSPLTAACGRPVAGSPSGTSR